LIFNRLGGEGAIEEIKEKIGGERRIYRVTEKGRKLLQTLITETHQDSNLV
jgi:DNA-binding PadR family transcriptional regulator